jgi:hypothetical protein
MKGTHALAHRERGIDQTIEEKKAREARTLTSCRAQRGTSQIKVEKAVSKSALTSCRAQRGSGQDTVGKTASKSALTSCQAQREGQVRTEGKRGREVTHILSSKEGGIGQGAGERERAKRTHSLLCEKRRINENRGRMRVRVGNQPSVEGGGCNKSENRKKKIG